MADLSFKKEFLDTGIVTKAQSWCFGKDPIVSPIQVGFAAGNNKFSICAGYTFTCPKNEKYPTLKVVYCPKLHSKTHRKDPANMTRWYLWQPIAKSGLLVLDSDKCEQEYGFDFYKFFKTDAFRAGQQIFKKAMTRGITEAMKLHDDLDEEKKEEFDTWIESLEEARDIVTEVPELNEKPYKLIDYDKFVQEIKDKGYEKELKDRSQKMADWNKKIGQRFMDRVKKNELKPGEQDNRIPKDNN